MVRPPEATRRPAPSAGTPRAASPPCVLCRDKVDWVDYKNVPMLRRYVGDRGRIRARRVTGNCARHQNEVAMAIKTARELVLMPRPARRAPEAPEAAGTNGGGR